MNPKFFRSLFQAATIHSWWTSVGVILLSSAVITGIVGSIKTIGGLESLELRTYDRLVRLRPDQGIDDRLLVVGITEDDLRSLNRSRASDQTVSDLLDKLQQHQPRVIGLDLYRDVPQEPGGAALQQRLQSSKNVIVITELGKTAADRIPPPPNVPPERIGFNDIAVDADGVVRRSLLFGSDGDGNNYASFGMTLAFSYLEAQGIYSQPTDHPDHFKIDQTVFAPLTKTSGGYIHNDDRGFQILLNYRSRRVVRSVSLRQVLQNEVSPDWIKDKIILIGNVAPSIKDMFYTPFSAGGQEDHQMPGVEVHAQIVSAVLSSVLNQQPLFRFWSEPVEWLWIFAWAFTGSTIAWCIRHPIALGLSSISLFASVSGTSFLLLLHLNWVPVVAPTIAAFLAMGSVTAFRAQQAQRQHQIVMTLLGQNTSKEIADALWQNRDRLLKLGKLPGQRLIATMIFTDIQGFSTVSEQLSPEALLEWLNEYLAAMTEAIQNYQGIINKFTGDGLLAVFGVPIPRTTPDEIAQDAYQAVACALAMGDRLRHLNQVWQQRGLHPIQMRVGIFTGPIVAGSLGGKHRLEYGVIGDSVNIASRLESCAKEQQVDTCRILIAQETLDYVVGQFEVESWGAMQLRGKQQEVEVYRVKGKK